MNLFQEVRDRVPMAEAAIRYGFEPDRQNRICCPFHNDSHPSLQLYKNGRGWWCYVCDMGGSVIDFTAKLFSLSVKDAALKLSEDFGLGLSFRQPRKLEYQQRRHQSFVRQIPAEKARREYEKKQKEFIELRQELFLLPRGGRAGEIMGRLFELEEWFQGREER